MILTQPTFKAAPDEDVWRAGWQPENVYLVQELSFVDEALDWRQWPAAILVSDLVEPYDIR